jgi:ferredoxin
MGEPRMARVFVDKDLCVGCGLCTAVCDEVFRMDSEGKADVLMDSNPDQPCVKEAIDGCPAEAISIEEF